MTTVEQFRIRLGIAVASALLGACDTGTPTDSTLNPDAGPLFSQSAEDSRIRAKRRETWSIRAANGQLLREDVMRASLDTVVREVALALRDPSTRAELYAALHASRYREHKLHTKSFLTADAQQLSGRLANRGLPRGTLTGLLDRIRELEMYIPQPEHFAAWQGGENLIVVGSLREHDEVFGYALDGTRFVVPEGQIPTTPALAIVDAETSFRKFTLANTCDPTVFICDGDPGGGGGIPPAIPGVYLTYMNLYDLHEGFPRGSPEIEVCLIARTQNLGMRQAGQCANEGGSGSGAATGHRLFDQDFETWITATYGVLVASYADLEAIAAADGVPVDSTSWMLHVWEDDTERGIIHDEDEEYKVIWFTAQAIEGFILLYGLNPAHSGFTECQQGPDSPAWCLIVLGAEAWGALNLVHGAYWLLQSAWNAITGANDDFVGTIVDADNALQEAGITSSHPYVLMRGSVKAGEVVLTYVP